MQKPTCLIRITWITKKKLDKLILDNREKKYSYDMIIQKLMTFNKKQRSVKNK